MKTKLTTIFKKSANTPPMWVCLLFALVISTNCWADPVTISFGSSQSYMFPGAGTSTNATYVVLKSIDNPYNCSLGYPSPIGNNCFYQITGGSIDIEAALGYIIKQVTIYEVYDPHPESSLPSGTTKIKFSSSNIYSDLSSVGVTAPITGITAWNVAEAPCVVVAPSNAKSARIFTENSLWGQDIYRIIVTVDEAPACAKPVLASFVASGNESSGSAPSNINACGGDDIPIPDNGTLVYDNKHIFVGWNDGVNTYAPNSVYTMSNENVQFTAVWKELNVTNLAITNPENNTIPLSWKIPGICDLSNYSVPSAQNTTEGGKTYSRSYDQEYDVVNCTGYCPQYGQYGVAFAVPNVENLKWISYECKAIKSMAWNVNIWAGVYAPSTGKMYWQFADPNNNRPTTESWKDVGPEYPAQPYWGPAYDGAPISNPITYAVSEIAIFANAGAGGAENQKFSVRNVRYGIAGQEDIDHIVLMRKPNAIPNDTTDGTKIYSGTRSKFTDSETKTPGTTYYYAVFAVYSDASVSSPVYVSHTMEAATEYTVTYAKGADNVTGDVPTEGDHIEGAHFTVADKGNLARPGHHFAGWNDGTTTYAVNASYTMPAENVTLTAVWNEFSVPQVTNLAITEPVGQTVPLSWSIPGICDLSAVVSASGKAINNSDEVKYGSNTTITPEVDPNDGAPIITAVGSAPQYGQYGIAFPIPATQDIESITVNCKGNSLPSGVGIWCGVIDETNKHAYWDGDKGNVKPSTFSSETFTIRRVYWNYGIYNKNTTTIHSLGVYANATSDVSTISFSVKEARYHIAGQEDIDHIVLVRKENEAPANPTDGTVLYSGTKSHFVDDSDAKEFGHTYYYRVFAFHEDGTYSASTAISHEIESVATCTVSFNIGEGAVGDAPAAITDKPVNGTVTMPSANALYKPFCTFAGWKKDGSEEAPLAAGSTYTVTAEDVTAETISFTAQWTEDNTTRRIPAEHILNYSNQSTSVATTDYWDVTDDNINDVCLDMRQKTAEWKVFIKPGYYDISTICAVPIWGISYRLSIVDPVTDLQVKELFYEHTDGDDSHAIIRNLSNRFDLTDLAYGKQYIIRIKDTWENCGLLVHDININPVTPKEIPDETHFDKDNAFSAVTTATDMDIDGEAGNDELINLDRKYVEWDVKVTPGVYNVSLVYGAPQYNINVSVALIDPENPESVIYLSKDGNHTYYYKSGSQNTPHHYTSTTRCDLTGIDGNKIYRLRISDEYGSSNSLRVKDLTFSPIAPEVISNVTDTRLDATNTILPPTMETDLDIDDDSNVDNLMNLYNTNAEWLVTLQKGLYNVQLVYGAPSYGIRVAIKLIDPSCEESDRVMSIQGDKDYYDKPNPATGEAVKTTPHHYTSATKCALLDVTEDKIYKVRVEDVYPKCNLRVSHVLFTPIEPIEIHEEATLDASNVMVAPSIVDSRIDISNQQEAVWYATIDPHKYDITLTYSAVSGGTKVRFAIIPVGGDTIFVHQENQHDASNTTYTIPALDQDLTGITSGVYKIIVKDNYKSNGSEPQIISLTFSRAMVTHTRSGLRVGDFGTICLPYAVAAEDRNGAELFEIEEWDPNGASLTLSQLNEDENMVAGRPYIFQATAATATFRYYAEGDEAAVGSNNGLVGSYEQALIPQNNDNYIIYNNKLYLVNSEAYVGAYRAYIHKQDQVQPAPANRRRVTLGVNGAQVATDIDLTNDPAQMTKYIENGHLFIFRDGKLYNAQGQLVK